MKFSKRNLSKAKRKFRQGRPIKPTERLIILRDFKSKRSSVRLALSAVRTAMSAFQVATIQSRVDIPKHEKAIKIAEIAIETAQSITETFKSEPIKHPFE